MNKILTNGKFKIKKDLVIVKQNFKTIPILLYYVKTRKTQILCADENLYLPLIII